MAEKKKKKAAAEGDGEPKEHKKNWREVYASVENIYRVLESDFVEEYHPFRYYLDHLPPYDARPESEGGNDAIDAIDEIF